MFEYTCKRIFDCECRGCEVKIRSWQEENGFFAYWQHALYEIVPAPVHSQCTGAGTLNSAY